MSSDILKSFAETPVRETSGSMSSNRFDYQKNWSLCELLELHANQDDYLMVFEHHEDVVVFDSQSDPSGVIFYQVKSKKSGNWTVGALTTSKKESPSIIEKLYENYKRFSDIAEVSLIFSSNQPLSAKLRNGDKSIDLGRVSFSCLSDKEKEKIRSAVEPPSQEYCNLHGLSTIETQKSDLRLSNHTSIAKGKLVEFFENLHPESQVHISLVYKTFFDEIRRKTNHEREIGNDSELLRHKAIGRSDFERMIVTVLNRRNDDDLWNDASNVLSTENFHFQQIRRIRQCWQEYIVAKMDSTNEFHAQFSNDVICEVSSHDGEYGIKTFGDLAEKIIPALSKKYKNEYDDEYVRSAILYEALRNEPISKTDTKLTEEEK